MVLLGYKDEKHVKFVIWFFRALIRALREVVTGWSTASFAAERFIGQRLVPSSVSVKLATASGSRQLKIIHSRVKKSPRRVWFGPFVGEVGYELLYWRGFVAASIDRLGLHPADVGVISRGGVRGWYSSMVSNYSDLYSIGGEALVQDLQTDTYPIAFDHRHKSLVTMINGSRRYWIHPNLMHQAIAEFKSFPERLSRLENVIAHRPITSEDLLLANPEVARTWSVILRKLPKEFVTVKFYSGSNLNNTKYVDRITRTLIALARDVPLIGLGMTVTTGSHSDWTSKFPGVQHVLGAIDPSINLGIQSLLISHSMGFLGTYGGFSYLPLYLRVPSLVVKDGETLQKPCHQVMEQHVAKTLNSKYRVIDLSTSSLGEVVTSFFECS